MPITPAEARAILGLAPDASPHEVIGAFRAAVKVVHPDRPGGDAERFRQILTAYRLLQSMPTPPAPLSAAEFPALAPYAEIGAMTAVIGGEGEARFADGRRIKVRIPAGARHGETLRVEGEPVLVRIRAEEALQVRGSDIWVTGLAAAFLLEEGGRATVETPLGPKVLWITARIAERRLIRLEGQGLPARGEYPQGSLFVRLAPDTGAPESPARTQLKKFASAWAA